MSTRWVTAVPNLRRRDKYSHKRVQNSLSGNVQVRKEGHMYLESGQRNEGEQGEGGRGEKEQGS